MSDAAFIHPEWVGDNQVWLDSSILHKIQFGDGVKGWAGDTNLAIYWNPNLGCFELWRWELGDYSLVARQKPGVVFDDRIIDELVRRDQWRVERDMAGEIEKANQAVQDKAQAKHDEMIAEEIAPRLRRSFIKEGLV